MVLFHCKKFLVNLNEKPVVIILRYLMKECGGKVHIKFSRSFIFLHETPLQDTFKEILFYFFLLTKVIYLKA